MTLDDMGNLHDVYRETMPAPCSVSLQLPATHVRSCHCLANPCKAQVSICTLLQRSARTALMTAMVTELIYWQFVNKSFAVRLLRDAIPSSRCQTSGIACYFGQRQTF